MLGVVDLGGGGIGVCLVIIFGESGCEWWRAGEVLCLVVWGEAGESM